ncbi:MAG: D-ribose pyranase [Chloroflexota bacterium]|nr:D-ribose pyranase [Chloroflexota bacterium]
MKKSTLLNSELSYVIATLGHTEMLVIADAGLPIPSTTERVDLALVRGVPSAIETLSAVLSEMQVESVILAKETQEINPDFEKQVRELLPDVPVDFVSHDELKRLSTDSRAVVRTGECKSYANVILVSGVAF